MGILKSRQFPRGELWLNGKRASTYTHLLGIFSRDVDPYYDVCKCKLLSFL